MEQQNANCFAVHRNGCQGLPQFVRDCCRRGFNAAETIDLSACPQCGGAGEARVQRRGFGQERN
jgi:hypothetical protein